MVADYPAKGIDFRRFALAESQGACPRGTPEAADQAQVEEALPSRIWQALGRELWRQSQAEQLFREPSRHH
jgi:hypothetical protein